MKGGLVRCRARVSDAAGSVTLELAIVAPALLLLVSLLVVGARVTAAGSAVEHAAAAAARAASLTRDARSAVAEARTAAQRSLVDQGVTCTGLTTQVETAGFAAALGQSADVTVRVACDVSLADAAIPGMPGTKRVQAEATSPLDAYRSRP